MITHGFEWKMRYCSNLSYMYSCTEVVAAMAAAVTHMCVGEIRNTLPHVGVCPANNIDGN